MTADYPKRWMKTDIKNATYLDRLIKISVADGFVNLNFILNI